MSCNNFFFSTRFHKFSSQIYILYFRKSFFSSVITVTFEVHSVWTQFGPVIQCKSVVIKLKPHSQVLMNLNVQLMCSQWRLWHTVLLLSVVFQSSTEHKWLELQYYLYRNLSCPNDNSAIAISVHKSGTKLMETSVKTDKTKAWRCRNPKLRQITVNKNYSMSSFSMVLEICCLLPVSWHVARDTGFKAVLLYKMLRYYGELRFPWKLEFGARNNV